jgi:HEPN domain-containing protein
MMTRRSLALLALLAFTLTHLTVAHAEKASTDATSPAPPPSILELLTGDAKRDYESARLLYDNGDYAGASVKFQSAYELSRAQNSKWEGDPRLLWNAASCEKNLRNYARAVSLVRRYLESRSPLVTPEGERAARAFLAAAEPLTAPLVVEANVPDALVYLDDKLLGKTPLDGSVRVDLGPHRLLVKKGEHADYVESFTIYGAEELRITAVLRRIERRGVLIVRASPGDRIALDGVLLGVGRAEASLQSGSHLLRVTAPGARPFEERVEVTEQGTRTLDVVLERESATSAVPGWVWAAGGSLATGLLMTGGYFLFGP